MGSIKNTVVKEVLKIAPYFKKSWRVDLKKKWPRNFKNCSTPLLVKIIYMYIYIHTHTKLNDNKIPIFI